MRYLRISRFIRWLLSPRNEAREPGFDAHRYQRQRRLGFPMLRFLPELEREYRESFFNVNVMRLRLAHVIGLLGCFGFIAMDRWLGYQLQTPASNAVLLGICCPALALPMAATFVASLHRYLSSIIFAGALGLGLGLVDVVYLGRVANEWFPYESIFLVTIYVYYLSGLLWIESMICGALIWNAYLFMDAKG
ncbi:MAG TPA: hypothetical protein VHE37_05265, partial [Nevskiaceae bacterium]|nr:hypothetical protein [Nevskiaceae bacterium]